MKRINFFLTFFVTAFSILGSADTNTVLINYFEKVYSEEKNKFLNCVEDEGLPVKDHLYTNVTTVG